jgi:hypothetical protein
MKRSTLIVVGVFVLLCAGAIVVLTQKPERGMTRLSLADLPKDKVDRVVFSGKDAVELKKDHDTWKLGNGKQADNAAVGRMLDALERVKSSDLLTNESKHFSEYDADDQKGTRLMAYAGGKVVADIVVGKNVSGGVAVRSGAGVFRVSSAAQATFVRTPGAWIEHKIFEDALTDATRLEVRVSGAPPYALVKNGSTWAIENPKVLPPGFRFDADAARSLVASFVNLRAKDFEDKDPGVATTGLDDSADTLTLTLAPAPATSEGKAEPGKSEATKAQATQPAPAVEATKSGRNGAEAVTAEAKAPAAEAKAAASQAKPAEAPTVRTLVLRLGKAKADKDVYAKVDGRDDIFTLHEYTAKSLRKSPLDLRDLRLMSFDKEKAQKLVVQDGKVALTFAKKNGAWELVKTSEPKPDGFELDTGAVERRLTSLASARALRVAEPKERSHSGLEGSASRLTVTLEGGTTASLVFGHETKDGDRDAVFVKGNADSASYLAAKWTRQSLLGGIATFKKQPEPQGMPNIDPKALSNLPPDVRESLMKQLQQKKLEQQMLKQIQAQASRAPANKAPKTAPAAK